MKALRYGCTGLLALVVLAGVGVAMLRYHFASTQEARYRSFRRDNILDHAFNARAPAPLEVNVMLSTAHGGYQVPADQPSLHDHIKSLGKLRVIVVLPGCGFPIWGKDVPSNVAVLSVGENPDLLDRKTTSEACMSSDDAALRRALDRQLALLMRYVDQATWIDRTRIMLAGYGEAAPLVAAYSGRVKQRLTLGDPCRVPWTTISDRTPVRLLFTTDPQGLTLPGAPPGSLDIAAIARGAGPSFPAVRACEGLRRPAIRPPARQVVAPGHLGVFDRPATLLEAQKLAYETL